MSPPILKIDLRKLRDNAKTIINLCKKNNLQVTGVIKGLSGLPVLAQILFEEGYLHIASSRIDQLKNLKSLLPSKQMMLIRSPMLSEIEDVIKYSDISLNSEKKVLVALNDACKKLKTSHQVILMYDVGDLREGLICKKELAELAFFVEKELSEIYLLGIGTNMTCYGTVIPDITNALDLCMAAKKVEAKIKRKIDLVSGGSTTSLPFILKENLPEKINHLRIGAAIIAPLELKTFWNTSIDGLQDNAITINAEVIEVNVKPTVPIGKLNVDGFGNVKEFVDLGQRKRAILALGNADVGDCANLIPLESGAQILGASSDHLILDINDCNRDIRLGDTLEFLMHYQNVLFSINQPSVKKEYVN